MVITIAKGLQLLHRQTDFALTKGPDCIEYWVYNNEEEFLKRSSQAVAEMEFSVE